MGTRLTAKQWLFFKDNYTEDLDKLFHHDLTVDRYSIFRTRYRNSKKKLNTNIERYGSYFGELINWLEENCSSQFYIHTLPKNETYRNVSVRVYFFDETDAMGFKLFIE